MESQYPHLFTRLVGELWRSVAQDLDSVHPTDHNTVINNNGEQEMEVRGGEGENFCLRSWDLHLFQGLARLYHTIGR